MTISFLCGVVDGHRNLTAGTIQTEDAGHVAKDGDGKRPGSELMELLSRKLENEAGKVESGVLKRSLGNPSLLTEWIGFLPKSELDEHFHRLVSGDCGGWGSFLSVVNGDFGVVLCLHLTNGWDVGRVERGERGEKRVCCTDLDESSLERKVKHRKIEERTKKPCISLSDVAVVIDANPGVVTKGGTFSTGRKSSKNLRIGNGPTKAGAIFEKKNPDRAECEELLKSRGVPQTGAELGVL